MAFVRVLTKIPKEQSSSTLAISTAFSAAFSMLSKTWIPASVRIRLPSSSFVPTNLITMGLTKPIRLFASKMPLATSSHLVMPPKILIKTTSTRWSDKTRLRAAAILSEEAPPPTSRKFAGFPPYSIIASNVAITKPAPFPITPMFPSSLTYANPLF